MKRPSVIVNLKVQHSDTETTCFLKVFQLIVVKVSKELETADRDQTLAAKCKMLAEGPNTIRIHNCVQHPRKSLIITHPPRQSIQAIAKDLKISEFTIRRVAHKEIQYKLYVM